MSMIIDCHTHCYPKEVSSAPRKWAEANNELHWAELVTPTDRKSIQDWATPEQMLVQMDRAGVDKAALLGWYWENEATCRWHNRIISDWVAQAPDRFIGFASILPNVDVIEQLEYAQELGLCGAGELHPGIQGFDSQDPHWLSMSTWCATHDWPVNFHASADSGDHPSAVATPLDDYLRMAEKTPELKIILAHWGGGIPWLTDQPLPKNLYFDSSANPLLYDVDKFREVIERVGPEKILFGSDYPLRLYPRLQKQADMKKFIDQIQNEGSLSDTELEMLFRWNAQQLFQHI
ncbi:MAG: amidohydrolase family protein [Verrucomicrobiota bacterium]